MRLIAEITHKDATGEENLSDIDYITRNGARGVLLNDENEVALMHQKNSGFHKLPGGGFEEGENPQQAFIREIKEETGFNCEVIKEIGLIKEYRDLEKQLSVSYAFVAKITGDQSKIKLTQEEKDKGMELVWFSMDKAIETLSNETSEEYVPKFILLRDKLILQFFDV